MSKPHTAHRFTRLQVRSGDTIEQWGYTPDDIYASKVIEDPQSNGTRTCLVVWVMSEVGVNDE